MENPENDRIAGSIMSEVFKGAVRDEEGPGIDYSMLKDMPLRALVNFSGGKFDDEKLEELLGKLNMD